MVEEIKEARKKFEEEIKKYMEEEKEKKAYSVYLTKEDVEYVKTKLKVPLSRFLDDMIRIMAMTFKNRESIKEENKKEDDTKKD